VTSGWLRKLVVVASSALVLTGPATASGLARQTPSAPRHVAIGMALPAPGRIAVRLFELKVTLKPGTVAPHALVVNAVDRTKLPKGVAVVASARLMKNSNPSSATYAAMVAVLRAKTSTKTVRHTASAYGSTEVYSDFFLTNYMGEQSFDDELNARETDAVLGEQAKWLNRSSAAIDGAKNFADLNLDNVTYGSTTAFSWSADKAPASSTAAGTVADDVAQSIYVDSLTPELLDEIETSLNVQFDNDFPEGSLDGDSPTSASGTTTTTPASSPSSLVKDVSLSISLNGFTGAIVSVQAAADAPREQVVVLAFTGPDIPSGKTVSVAPGKSVPVSISVASTVCGTWKIEIVSDNGVAVHAGSNPALEVGWTHPC
jgi:hypothetical protein